MSLNNVALNGRITRNLELKYTGSGTAILNFNVAVERDFKNKQGERETDFINVVAFGKTAETISNFFNKGDGIIIQGRIQSGQYENNEGRTIYTTDVAVNNFSFAIGTKNSSGNQSNNYQNNNSNSQQNNQNNNNSAFENDDVIDIQDDLPF